MSEKVMRKAVVEVLAPLRGFAVENLCKPGTPDVFYIGGCIECKQSDDWPKRAGTKVKFKAEFTKLQRIFLKRWCTQGGMGFVLVQVRQEWLLFWGTVAANLLGELTRQQMYDESAMSWTSKKEMKEGLINALESK